MKYFLFNIEELYLLEALKNEGNMSKAAKRLYISQSSLSLQLKKLEEKVHSKILERNKKQIIFTPLGELINDYTSHIISLYGEADRAILYYKNFHRTNLVIGSNEPLYNLTTDTRISL